ncbi:MAG: hypothetical protein AABX29_09540 [Nanoarchaeota archaeon]
MKEQVVTYAREVIMENPNYMLGLIGTITGSLSFITSLILTILKLKEYYKNRSKIEIDLHSSGAYFEDIPDTKRKEASFKMPDGRFMILPKKIPRFEIRFSLRNTGPEVVGIKNIELIWKAPKLITDTRWKDQYILNEEIIEDPFKKKEYLRLNGNEIREFNLVGFVQPVLAILIEEKQSELVEIYKKINYESKNYVWPKGISIEIKVTNSRDKTASKIIDPYLN